MEKKENNKYFEAKDAEGTPYICPVDGVDKNKAVGGEIDDEICFEKDVMGRYAADIEIE